MPGARMRLGLFLCTVLALSILMVCLWLMTRYGFWPQH